MLSGMPETGAKHKKSLLPLLRRVEEQMPLVTRGPGPCIMIPATDIPTGAFSAGPTGISTALSRPLRWSVGRVILGPEGGAPVANQEASFQARPHRPAE